MSYARHSQDVLDQVRDEVEAELAKLRADILDQVPTCSERGITDFDLECANAVADAVAQARLDVLSRINSRLRTTMPPCARVGRKVG